MNAIYKIKRNDTWPPLRATLLQVDGIPIDLTNASVEVFIRSLKSSPIITIRKGVNVVDALAGRVECWLDAVDTSISGTYKAEFEIVFAGGERATVPNSDYFKILIIDDIL